MDYVRRIALLVLLLFSASAYAVTTTVPATFAIIYNNVTYATATDACLALYGPNPNYSNISGTDTAYQYTCAFRYLNANSTNNFQKTGVCKFGNLQGASCVFTSPDCVLPQTLDTNTNTCVSPCQAGLNDLNGDLYSGTCVNGCTHWTQGSGIYVREKPATVWYVSLRANTGAVCTTSSQSKVSADAAAAAAAKKLIDDAAATAAAKSAADKLASQNAAAAAATAKAAADKAVADAKAAADKAAAVSADPSSTQAQKDAANAAASAAQSNADSKNAASSAAAGSAAAAAKDDTKPDKPEFCESHPTSIICKDSSVNKGTCSNGVLSGFTCEGDVATCAIAQSQAESACRFGATDDSLTAKYNEAKNDNPSNNPSLPQNASTINIPSALDESSPYGGSCNPDTTISFNGASVTIPFSKWCDVLNALGYLFLACAYISAAIILGGAI